MSIFGLSEEASLALLGGGLFVGLAALLTVWATRKRDVNTNSSAIFADALRIQTLVDTAVDRKTKDLVSRLSRLEKAIKTERTARRTLRSVFLSYVDRVQNDGSKDLTDEEREAIEAEPDDIELEITQPVEPLPPMFKP